MAKFIFTGDHTGENGFFHSMREDIITTVNEPGKMFDQFGGTFEISMDKERPRARYHQVPDEEVNEGLLKSYLFLLNYKLITFSLKNRK
jgi:hypothetical protein